MNSRLLALLPLLLIGCGEWRQTSAAQEAVARQLTDPASAQFLDVKIVTAADGNQYVCGAVKGKNRMGSYAGFRDFVYSVETAEVLLGPAESVTPPGGDAAMVGATPGFEFVAKHLRSCVPG